MAFRGVDRVSAEYPMQNGVDLLLRPLYIELSRQRVGPGRRQVHAACAERVAEMEKSLLKYVVRKVEEAEDAQEPSTSAEQTLFRLF